MYTGDDGNGKVLTSGGRRGRFLVNTLLFNSISYIGEKIKPAFKHDGTQMGLFVIHLDENGCKNG